MIPDLEGRCCSFFEKIFILSLKNYLVLNTIEIFPLKSKIYEEKDPVSIKFLRARLKHN